MNNNNISSFREKGTEMQADKVTAIEVKKLLEGANLKVFSKGGGRKYSTYLIKKGEKVVFQGNFDNFNKFIEGVSLLLPSFGKEKIYLLIA